MSYIKAKGWANGLSAGSYPICPGTPGIFKCEIYLTEDGLKDYRRITDAFFQYVSLLRGAPPHEWMFEEQKGMADVDFKFTEKIPPWEFTSEISAVIQRPLPPEWLLSGESLLRRFDSEAITKYIKCL